MRRRSFLLHFCKDQGNVHEAEERLLHQGVSITDEKLVEMEPKIRAVPPAAQAASGPQRAGSAAPPMGAD